jgi:excisionase family DNA binding protein
LSTKRTLTISEAAELTGLSRKAMARRVERGSIRSVLRSGRRLIPRSELIRVGLLPPEGYKGVDRLADSVLSRSVAVSEEIGGEQSLLEVLVRELLDRVQRQAGELAQQRALTAEAESLRLEREMADLRVRLSALESVGTQRMLEHGSSDARSSSQSRVGQAEGPFSAAAPQNRLWLPPQAAPERARLGQESMAPPFSARPGTADARVSRSRIAFLIAEMLFIGLAAFLAWLADLGPALAAAAVGIAWLVAATFELVRWRTRV